MSSLRSADKTTLFLRPGFPLLFVFLFLAVLSLNGSARIFAQTTEESIPTSEEVSRRIESIRSDKELAPEVKTELETTLQKTLDVLKSIAQWKTRERDFLQKAAQKIQPKEESSREISDILASYPASISTDLSVEQTAAILASAEMDQKSQKNLLAELDEQASQMAKRRQEIPGLLGEAKKRLETSSEITTPTDSEQISAESTQTRKGLSSARRILAKTEIQGLETELATFEQRQNLLKARREHATQLVNRLSELVQRLQESLGQRKLLEAEEASRKAKRDLEDLANSLPALKKLAEENALFAQLRASLAQQLDSTTQSLDKSSQLQSRFSEESKNVRERIRATGFSEALGMLLRVKQSELPSTEIYRKRLDTRKSQIAQTQLQIMDFEEKQRELSDLDRAKRLILSIVTLEELPLERRPSCEKLLQELLEKQKESLEVLLKDSHIMLGKLVDLDTVDRDLIEIVESYSAFINERIFWIRSCQPLSFSDLARAGRFVLWIVAPERWSSFLNSLWSGIAYNWLLTVLGIGFLSSLAFRRPRILKQMAAIAEKVRPAQTDRFHLTVTGVALSAIISSVVPLGLAGLAWLAKTGETGSAAGREIPEALLQILPWLWALLFFRNLFREGGVVKSHFLWRVETSSRMIRTALLKLALISIPLFFLHAMAEAGNNETMQDSLGRIMFFLALVSVGAILGPLLLPGGEVFGEIEAGYSKRLIHRVRYLVFALGVLFPWTMGFSALLGYYFTAQQLFIRSLYTLLFLFSMLIIYGMVLRALQVQRRNLALQQAFNRQQASDQEKAEDTPNPDSREIKIQLDSPPNIYTLSTQTQKIIYNLLIISLLVGLWLIWRGMFPAFRIFDQLPLWTTEMKIAETITAPDGTVSRQLVNRMVPVTPIDVVLAIIVLGLTWTAAGNIPGFLEFWLLQRLDLDNGIRFATRTLTSYLITIVGFIGSFHLIGITWDKVQWLVAAVSVGLGFGLQEIFANFVSGLIILFERPMRVGDVVTVGDLSGTVTRIQIRATTILNWDRKELIIPNREFITGRLINWTLTDSILRITCKVGVAYGSDVEKTRNVLLNVARSHSRVLKDPPPAAILVGFGDSSLDFELRVFIPNLENYPDFQHEIHAAVNRALAEAQIEIPFPQRDLHLRTNSTQTFHS